MYHIYKNDKEITKVNWWCDVVEYIEKQGLSRKHDIYQDPNDTYHWYFGKGEKMIEVKLKDE